MQERVLTIVPLLESSTLVLQQPTRARKLGGVSSTRSRLLPSLRSAASLTSLPPCLLPPAGLLVSPSKSRCPIPSPLPRSTVRSERYPSRIIICGACWCCCLSLSLGSWDPPVPILHFVTAAAG